MSSAFATQSDLAIDPVLPGRVDARRVEELGRIIIAYSEVTDKLQQSHEMLQRQVEALRGELSEKNKQLERSNRLAALGEMAAGMAHEIRNPLGGIQLYASLLAKDVADRPGSLRVVEKISNGVKRLESLVSQTLHFTREMRVNRSRVDLAEIVEQSLELASARLHGEAIELIVRGEKELPVDADATLMGQVVLNLLLNAAEAMAENADRPRRLTVQYGAPPSSSEARHFHLSVTDTGPGIGPDVMDRIFNPFFTTKDTGTGLGLSIVHRIIEAHDGAITVKNLSGGGCGFEIRV